MTTGTLILAIACEDGIVLASDGQVTAQIDRKRVKIDISKNIQAW